MEKKLELTGGQGKGRETQGAGVGGRGRGNMGRVLEIADLRHGLRV
jgi:hypothetical protein